MNVVRQLLNLSRTRKETQDCKHNILICLLIALEFIQIVENHESLLSCILANRISVCSARI